MTVFFLDSHIDINRIFESYTFSVNAEIATMSKMVDSVNKTP